MREIRSFVVRIYRRGPQGVSGVVEDVQTGGIHYFHSALDLWLVLAGTTESNPQGKAP